jgi:hypothetical protein
VVWSFCKAALGVYGTHWVGTQTCRSELEWDFEGDLVLSLLGQELEEVNIPKYKRNLSCRKNGA